MSSLHINDVCIIWSYQPLNFWFWLTHLTMLELFPRLRSALTKTSNSHLELVIMRFHCILEKFPLDYPIQQSTYNSEKKKKKKAENCPFLAVLCCPTHLHICKSFNLSKRLEYVWCVNWQQHLIGWWRELISHKSTIRMRETGFLSWSRKKLTKYMHHWS